MLHTLLRLLICTVSSDMEVRGASAYVLYAGAKCPFCFI